MRNLGRALNNLATHSRQPDYKFERLYRLLFDERMYHVAYQRTYTKEGNMTRNADNKSIDCMSIVCIEKLITSLKDKTYQPVPSRRMYIPKKSREKYPLGVPTFNDKLLQEVVRTILETIYESNFNMNSHGFRPRRSCHMALRQIQQTFNGARWFIEGDIEGLFDDISHDMVITILGKRITDERFLRLIRKSLNVGYIKNWTLHRTYSGTPQGGIISPILANIYLDQLDRYTHEYIQCFDKGKERTDNPGRIRFEYGRRLAVLKLKEVKDEEERKSMVREIKGYDKGRVAVFCGVDMDENLRWLKYIRYADDFLCAVIGTKAEAETIGQDIKMFLREKLVPELSEEKTLITHERKSAKFLGYEVYVWKSTQTRRNKVDKLTRPYNNKIYLKVPLGAVQKKLFDYNALQIKVHSDREQYKPGYCSYLINNGDLGILERYNSEVKGVYDYYSPANNCYTLRKFRYIMGYGMYKALTAEHESMIVKICKKYKEDKVLTVYYKNSKGKTLVRQLCHDGFKRKRQDYIQHYDKLPTHYFSPSTSLVTRLKAYRCELCGRGSVRLDVHHVYKPKNLWGKEDWEKHMIARKRKTIALCRGCHKRVDGGWMNW